VSEHHKFWLPMSSAPHDRTLIVINRRADDPAVVHWLETGWYLLEPGAVIDPDEAVGWVLLPPDDAVDVTPKRVVKVGRRA
jgi:hypothetical protein